MSYKRSVRWLLRANKLFVLLILLSLLAGVTPAVAMNSERSAAAACDSMRVLAVNESKGRDIPAVQLDAVVGLEPDVLDVRERLNAPVRRCGAGPVPLWVACGEVDEPSLEDHCSSSGTIIAVSSQHEIACWTKSICTSVSVSDI